MKYDETTICLAGGCFWGMEASTAACPVSRTSGAAMPMETAPPTPITRTSAPASPVSGSGAGDLGPGKTSLEALLFAFFAVVDVELPNRQGTGHRHPR